MNIELIKKWERDPSHYLRDCTIRHGQVRHYRFIVNSMHHNIHSLKKQFNPILHTMPAFIELLKNFEQNMHNFPLKSFDLDLMVIKTTTNSLSTVDAPFGNLDFECNGLIMDKYGIRLSEFVKPLIKNPIQRQRELVRVLDDILQKKAIMCERVTLQRSKKMLAKDWLIQSRNIRIVNNNYLTEQSESSSDDGSSSTGGHCIICHDECENPHYKLSCCDARYHGKCLVECWNNSSEHSIKRTRKCPMCRISLYGTNDADLYPFHTDDIYIDTLNFKFNIPIPRIRNVYNPIDFNLIGLPPLNPPSAVNINLLLQSIIRPRSDSAEKPAKTTECTAPIRAQANKATAACGIIGK
jgi:hypothetical protein